MSPLEENTPNDQYKLVKLWLKIYIAILIVIYYNCNILRPTSVHWDWTDSPVGSKDEMVTFIEENFVRRTDVYSPTFELLQFLFACVSFN